MHVVIVGASGNLGTALVRQLASDPAIEVDAVSRRRPALNGSGPYRSVRSWATIDVGAPGAVRALTAAFAGADAVVNFAWGFQPTRRPELLHRTGVGGTAHVVESAAAAGVAHLVHTSSVGAYARRTDLRPVAESYPVTGVAGSVYSQHKAEAEALLDNWERDNPDRLAVSRLRPGFVLQYDAGAALFRYGLPGWLPGAALRFVPLLPLDDSFVIPVVATSDVADAVTRLLRQPVGGAVNLAAERVVTRDDIAAVLGARPVNVPPGVLEAVVQGSWRLHVQPLDVGWIRLAYAVPMLDTSRAQAELGWTAMVDPVDALRQAVAGMRAGDGVDSPVLRPRSVRDSVTRLIRRGPISRREQS